MKVNQGLAVGIAVCAIIFLTLVLKGKMEWLLNLFMRSILGTIAIYFINEGLDYLGLALGVGVNPITILTSGVLGFPGLLALYGIKLYKFL